ncbi:MAG: protein-glutamate O-methyltransferase [Roseovarius sp.]|uniref:CheR family methyltransferase n=1 Tax=Roseovarius sp. TaxID=1486281 RepID=UPI0032EE0FA5
MSGILSPAAGAAINEVDDRSFRRLADRVYADCGIVLSDGKRNLVTSRLARRLRDLGLEDFDAYCRFIEAPDGAEERRQMISLLTTNVTKFFREAHHFTSLEQQVLPPLAERARAGGRVRIWSAGCSSGQEPYSIAATLRKVMPDAAKHDVRILGTDIDPEMIRLGRAAVYPDAAEAPIPPEMRRLMFGPAQPSDKVWRIVPDLKALVTLTELNLMQDWPMRGRFDVIFCRNVVIYFDAPTQARLWTRFAEVLAPGGFLFVGHSERVSGPAASQFGPAGVTQYRRL